jgi:hypothetical protein
MTGKTKHILPFLVVDLLWKRKKGQGTASQMQTNLVTYVREKTDIHLHDTSQFSS